MCKFYKIFPVYADPIVGGVPIGHTIKRVYPFIFRGKVFFTVRPNDRFKDYI